MPDFPASLNFKLLHVGVAVPSLEPTTKVFSTLFGYKVVAGPFDDPVQKGRVNFLATPENDVAEIELIAPLCEDSPIQSMLTKDGRGAYDLYCETSHIDSAATHAENKGCRIISSPDPTVAFQGRRVAIYTRSRQPFELVSAGYGSRLPLPGACVNI